LKRIISRTLLAKQKSDYKFGLLINYKEPNQRLFDKICSLTKTFFSEDNVFLKIDKGYGVGTAFLTCIFDYISNESVYKKIFNVLMDGDSRDISNSYILDGIRTMSECLSRKNLLLGLGARDDVFLTNDKNLEEMREVEEIYHAMFFKKIILENPFDLDLSAVPTPYKKFGDPIPGFYILNCLHKKFRILENFVSSACQKADLTRYAGDTYVILKASTLSKIYSIYLPTLRGEPGIFKKETIRAKSLQLAKIDIKQKYEKVVKNKNNEKILSKFYNPDNVKEVKRLILNGLQ
jgi:hypothetical protein